MTSHNWGDSWVGWDQLYSAERFIGKWFKRLTGSYISMKEKYGTIRYERFVAFYWKRDVEYSSKRYKKFASVNGKMAFGNDCQQMNSAWNNYDHHKRPFRLLKYVYERYYFIVILAVLMFIACYRFPKARNEIVCDQYAFKSKTAVAVIQFLTRTKSYWS